LPLHLQHLIFASAAAPLTTCKDCAAISQDDSLVARWLLVKQQQPLLRAAKHQLWDICAQLLGSYKYTPDVEEIHRALQWIAAEGQATLVRALLPFSWEHSVETCCSIGLDCVRKALLMSVRGRHASAATVLVATRHVTDYGVRWVMEQAAKLGHLDMMELLITSRPGASSRPDTWDRLMCSAAEGGQVEAMEWLMQQGVGGNSLSITPWSDWEYHIQPLMCAVQRGQLGAIR
jgi:hypothetical protein